MTATTKNALVIGGASAAVAAVILMLTVKPADLPEKNPDSCIYIEQEKIESWFREGWNDPTKDNYIHSLMFVAYPPTTGNEISKVEIIPVHKNAEGRCEIMEGYKREMKILDYSDIRCEYPVDVPSNDTTSYTFVPDDSYGSDIIHWKFLRIIPVASAENPGKLEFRVEMIIRDRGQEIPYRRTEAKNARPCPPYCHN